MEVAKITESVQAVVEHAEKMDWSPWGSEAKFYQWLRGGLRRFLWNKHPVKLEFLRKKRYKYPMGKKTKVNPNGMVWVGKCEQCEQRFLLGQCEVDHRQPSGSLRTAADILPFIVRLAFITPDDLRLLCKSCHKLITLAHRKGISIEEALLEKDIIDFTKKGIREQKEFLIAHGCSTREISNARKREQLYRRIATNEFERRKSESASSATDAGGVVSTGNSRGPEHQQEHDERLSSTQDAQGVVE